MTRKEFLEALGITTVVTCLGCSKASPLTPIVNSTTKDSTVTPHTLAKNALPNSNAINHNHQNTNPPPSKKVDFTIFISQPQYKNLQVKGGFAYHKGVIIARTLQDSFIAASEYCSHNGVTIEYNGSANKYSCPAHGSAFTTKGEVINGPALEAIKTYKTGLNGAALRVFEE